MTDSEWLRAPLASVMATDLITVGPKTPITEATALILDAGVGGIPVVDDGGRLLGIATKTDLLGAWHGREATCSVVSDIMMPMTAVLPRDATVSRAAAIMALDSTHRIAVVDGEGRLEGLVSALDLLAVVGRADGYPVPTVRRPDEVTGKRKPSPVPR